jgi:hypothetical protein
MDNSKKEAEQLVLKHFEIVGGLKGNLDITFKGTKLWEESKQNALITIDKNLLLLDHIEERMNDSFIYSLKLHYNKVRTEIKKL